MHRPAAWIRGKKLTQKLRKKVIHIFYLYASLTPIRSILVVIGGRYDPSLLPDYSPNDLALVHDKLVQHDIRNIENNLIPAWDIAKGLRPGTVIGVKAALHVYNIPNQRAPGFRRVRDSHIPIDSLK